MKNALAAVVCLVAVSGGYVIGLAHTRDRPEPAPRIVKVDWQTEDTGFVERCDANGANCKWVQELVRYRWRDGNLRPEKETENRDYELVKVVGKRCEEGGGNCVSLVQ